MQSTNGLGVGRPAASYSFYAVFIAVFSTLYFLQFLPTKSADNGTGLDCAAEMSGLFAKAISLLALLIFYWSNKDRTRRRAWQWRHSNTSFVIGLTVFWIGLNALNITRASYRLLCISSYFKYLRLGYYIRETTILIVSIFNLPMYATHWFFLVWISRVSFQQPVRRVECVGLMAFATLNTWASGVAYNFGQYIDEPRFGTISLINITDTSSLDFKCLNQTTFLEKFRWTSDDYLYPLYLQFLIVMSSLLFKHWTRFQNFNKKCFLVNENQTVVATSEPQSHLQRHHSPSSSCLGHLLAVPETDAENSDEEILEESEVATASATDRSMQTSFRESRISYGKRNNSMDALDTMNDDTTIERNDADARSSRQVGSPLISGLNGETDSCGFCWLLFVLLGTCFCVLTFMMTYVTQAEKVKFLESSLYYVEILIAVAGSVVSGVVLRQLHLSKMTSWSGMTVETVVLLLSSCSIIIKSTSFMCAALLAKDTNVGNITEVVFTDDFHISTICIISLLNIIEVTMQSYLIILLHCCDFTYRKVSRQWLACLMVSNSCQWVVASFVSPATEGLNGTSRYLIATKVFGSSFMKLLLNISSPARTYYLFHSTFMMLETIFQTL